MILSDFKVGTTFLYSKSPLEKTDTEGIGKIIKVHNGLIVIEWLWRNKERHPYAPDVDTYIFDHVDSWQAHCQIISDREKFELLLKYNFS